VAFDDKVVQYQKYTSSGTFQLFLKVSAPLASTHSPNRPDRERPLKQGRTRKMLTLIVQASADESLLLAQSGH
jgi:hypothetical protein